MNRSDPVNTPRPIMSPSADASHKRRRGCPGKDSSLNFEENGSGEKNTNAKRGSITHNRAGYDLENGHPRPQDNRGEGGSNSMLGRVVSGVIEGVFDAGYLLCVRVGNGGTTLRGVVFKPGCYAPISALNDVAPDVQMIKRDGREFSSSPGNGTFSFNEATQTKQPSDLVKGAPVSNQSSYGAASKGKQVQTSITSNESTPVAAAVDKEACFSQIGQWVDTEGIHFEYDSSKKSISESKSMNFPGLPFENLVTEVIKRIHPSPLKEIQMNFNQFANHRPEEENDKNAAQPLIVEPLRAVQPDPPAKTESIPQFQENSGAYGMSELLQDNSRPRDKSIADMTATRDLGMDVDK